MATRVSIVDDSVDDLDFYSELVNRTPGFICSGRHRTVTAALGHLPGEKPDIVLMDILMAKEPAGIECLWKLRAAGCEFCILMLTAFSDDELLFQSLRAGANGFLLKSDPPSKTIQALEDATKGDSPMSASIARRVIEHFRTAAPADNPMLRLTPKQTEVLRHLSQGASYKEIADRVGISMGTLRSHIRQIYERLHVHSRTEAAVLFERRRVH